MNPDLEKLINLHRAESELKRLDSELAEVPRLRGELDERVAVDRGRLETARKDLETSQKSRRQHEAEVQDLETKRSKYKGQLMEVKTNKEYTAMLHEIETVEREIRSREDRILEEMEKAETLTQEVAREEEAFRSVEKVAKGEAAELDARKARLEKEHEQVAAERDRVAATIPEEELRLYQRVAKLRGSGMAEARDGMCQTCHVKLRPQMWVEIRQNETLFQCTACNRILYYEPPPPTVVIDP
jgi:predicted  nucleic acid-binding Zn-ribbon protein